MGSVHHIDGDEIVPQSGGNQECIECLERVLEKARNGEIVGVAMAAQYADGSTSGPAGGFLYNSRIVGELMIRVTKLSGGA